MIEKSKGVTPTECFLAELCEKSFLNLWSYPNPVKQDGKELCDLIVIFDNQILLFFDRESHRLKNANNNIDVQWKRWRKEVIDKQIKTAKGAERYLNSKRPIFISSNDGNDIPLPIPVSDQPNIYKIIVAHGAKEACKTQSTNNVSGSLGITYGQLYKDEFEIPFIIDLDSNDTVHVLDSENLQIVLTELDTIFDFTKYLETKEEAIKRHKMLTYCGEEDLLAHYLLNFDKQSNRHQIGLISNSDNIHIVEGEWRDFVNSKRYLIRQNANESSYIWDELIQITSNNALNDKLTGNSDPFTGKSGIHFMAKEPRFVRRAFSDRIIKAIKEFPEDPSPIIRHLSLMPSFFEGTIYIFLQLKIQDKGDFETEYRPKRTGMLEIACGAAKLKWPELKRIVGIAIDAPKFAGETNSEDILLMEFDNWNTKEEKYYSEMNEYFGFFKNGRETKETILEFPEK